MAKEHGAHGGQPEPKANKGPSEGPSGYNGPFVPDSKELGAPTKVYPGSEKLGHDHPKDLIEGPCTGQSGYGGYHK